LAIEEVNDEPDIIWRDRVLSNNITEITIYEDIDVLLGGELLYDSNAAYTPVHVGSADLTYQSKRKPYESSSMSYYDSADIDLGLQICDVDIGSGVYIVKLSVQKGFISGSKTNILI
jgi:hypothetical protein